MNATSLRRYVMISSMLFFVFNIFGQITHPESGDQYCNKVHAARHLFNPLLRTNPLTENYDLKYYRFEWEIDPAVYGIKGVVTPYFSVESNGFKEINFDFSNNLVVSSVKWHGTSLAFQQPSDYLLKIEFPEILNYGKLDSLSIAYEGSPPSGGFGSFIQSTHASTPVLWTLSEPFGAQDWWPCKNGLNDKIDSIDVFITTPSIYRAASNGNLVSEIEVSDNKKKYHWKHRYSITPYLVAIAVTNYKAYTDNVLLSDGSTMPMVNYVYPESEAAARKGTADNVKVLQFYDSLFVDYPFKKEKYGHAQFGWGGGMEHQTMSFVVNYDWGLLSHELGHQWFGDFVTCGNWEDIWLNEGFATYLEGLTRERYPQAFNDWTNWKQGKINSITSNSSGSVRVDDPTNVNRIFSSRLSYNKGSYILHMLRWKLGDEAFFSALRNYLNARAYNYATTDHLKSHLEAVSGQNLSEFFSDWYEGQGFPTYNLVWAQKASQMRLKLNQSSSSTSVSFFEMPFEIKFKGQGKEKYVRFDNTFSGQEYDIDIDFKVESVEFDPNLWLAAKSNVKKDDLLLSALSEVSDIDFQLYPNPANYGLTIIQNNNSFDKYRVYDLNGRLHLEGQMFSRMSVLDIQHLNKGTYFITLIGKKGTVVKKFIKE